MAKQTIDHNGFQYEVDKICDVMDAGLDDKSALRSLYPSLPPKSVAPILHKVKKHSYFIARKDLKLNIIEAKAPELQNNLIDIALDGRSERNRLDATINALDRIYGNAKDDDAKQPQYVFNFSFGGSSGPVVVKSEVIDAD